jgi:hypothetical protein
LGERGVEAAGDRVLGGLGTGSKECPHFHSHFVSVMVADDTDLRWSDHANRARPDAADVATRPSRASP